MSKSNVVRGYGPLDCFIANLRHAKALSLIGNRWEGQRSILDIGCGPHPYFLEKAAFSKRVGVDQSIDADCKYKDISIHRLDLESVGALCFEDNTFDVVSMLAVIEHIEPENVSRLLTDIRRVLKPGAMLVLTTPAPWSDRLLRTMAKCRLISSEEIEDHKAVYGYAKLIECFNEAGFKKDDARVGYFEMFLNVWATAIK